MTHSRKYEELPDTFGRWTVLFEDQSKRYACGTIHRQVRVRCQCGTEETRNIYSLLSGQSKGCRRCARKIRFEVGQRFGCLTVTDPEVRGHRHGPNRGTYAVRARCDCGKVRVYAPSDLNAGRHSSCGCAIQSRGSGASNWTGHGEIAGNFFARIRTGAERRGFVFDITIELIWDLFLQQGRVCALSGVPLVFGYGRGANGAETTASLDRIDSSKGYIAGNVQWIHKDLNRMKLDHPIDTFVEWCRRVASHHEEL